MSKSTKIAIIGAGTFGLSTALELARLGYTDVTCYDKYPVPSPIAAGNDSNKIFDYEYIAPEEKPTTGERLALEAKDLWQKDPVFKEYYHPVGFIVAASSEKPLQSTEERFKELKEKGYKDYEFLDSPDQFRKHLPVLEGELPNWRGYVLDKDNGWLHARNALISAYEEAKKLGVKFVFGEDGEVVGFDSDGELITGIKSKSGKVFKSEKYVLTAGANAVSVLNFNQQLEGKCFTLAHIKVSDEEASKFKDLPVIFNYEKGFFFEADENNEIKICNEFPGYTNLNEKGESMPFYKMEIPLEAAEDVRQYLRETMPKFADRPFVKTRICWCTDSPDRELILCTHPKYLNLSVASGDSGKSFMLLPVIGKYVAKIALYGDHSSNEEDRKTWRWRPETSDSRDNTQDRYGGKGIVTDLKDIDLWVSAENPIPHKLQVE